jgi:hypothetical protein
LYHLYLSLSLFSKAVFVIVVVIAIIALLR